MHGKVKLTRRQLKEDKFTTLVLASKDRLMSNWQYAAIGALAVVLLIVAVVYYFNSRSSAVNEGGTKLASALMDYRSGNTQVAILTLNQVVSDFGGSDAARQAAFLLGRVNFDTRNYAEAQRSFEQFLQSYGDDPFTKAAALAGIAACQENQANYKEAAAKYAEAIAAYPDGPMAGDYKLAAMRTSLQAGDTNGARTYLNDIKDQFAGTDLANRAARLFAEKGSAPAGS